MTMILPGMSLAVLIAMAAAFVSTQHGGPVMLYALLFGIAVNYLRGDERCSAGLQFCSKTGLRIGVALLGARIMAGDVMDLGWGTIGLVVAGIIVTLGLGTIIGKAFGLKTDHALLSAGAVAICGASAALAISAVLPNREEADRNTLVTIVVVTGLSTIAMILYPLIAKGLMLGPDAAGIFLGATIHDVAQVVGAGYMISPDVGETATIVKLMRVACLAPVVLAIGLWFRSRRGANTQGDTGGDTDGAKDQRGAANAPILPLFLFAFIGLIVLNSAGFLPLAVSEGLGTVSRACLVTAVAALGVRTSLQDIVTAGPAPLLTLSAQTLLLAGVVLTAVLWIV